MMLAEEQEGTSRTASSSIAGEWEVPVPGPSVTQPDSQIRTTNPVQGTTRSTIHQISEMATKPGRVGNGICGMIVRLPIDPTRVRSQAEQVGFGFTYR